MEDAPGGGMMVTLRDPEGFLLNFVWGQELREGNKISERLLMNDEAVKDRKGAYQRFENGPAAVYKVARFATPTLTTEANCCHVAWALRPISTTCIISHSDKLVLSNFQHGSNGLLVRF